MEFKNWHGKSIKIQDLKPYKEKLFCQLIEYFKMRKVKQTLQKVISILHFLIFECSN